MCAKSIIWKIRLIISLLFIFTPIFLEAKTICNDNETQLIIDQDTVIPPLMCVTVGTKKVESQEKTNPESINQEIEIEIEKNTTNQNTTNVDIKKELIQEEHAYVKKNKTNNNIYSIIILGISYLAYKLYRYN